MKTIISIGLGLILISTVYIVIIAIESIVLQHNSKFIAGGLVTMLIGTSICYFVNKKLYSNE